MTPTYSVVVPVYNAEKYLEICVNSILQQHGAHNYEIILVNDGSADGSAQLCDQLSKQEPRIKVIHQLNQGVSVARNVGIAAAKGEYILFLDSDDIWTTKLLETVTNALFLKPDMAVFGYQQFGDQCDAIERVPQKAAQPETGALYFKKYEEMGMMPIANCWASAFKRLFLLENGLQFPADVCYGEDITFHMQCLKCARSVVSICEPLYRYRMNETSVTHTVSVKKIRDMLSSCVNIYRLFPGSLLANYYCMKILNLERIGKHEAKALYGLLQENRDVLRDVSGIKPHVACVLYKLFGWYGASRLVQMWFRMRHSQKG